MHSLSIIDVMFKNYQPASFRFIWSRSKLFLLRTWNHLVVVYCFIHKKYTKAVSCIGFLSFLNLPIIFIIHFSWQAWELMVFCTLVVDFSRLVLSVLTSSDVRYVPYWKQILKIFMFTHQLPLWVSVIPKWKHFHSCISIISHAFSQFLKGDLFWQP